MRYREPFKIFPKKLKSGKRIYYYTTYDLFNNRKQYSTGETKRSLAYKYCLELFKTDNLLNQQDITFSNYTKDWFDYDDCEYIRGQLARGKTYSRTKSIQQRSRLVNSMIPFLGNLNMNRIEPKHIELWLIKLKEKKLSNSSINLYLSTLRLIFNYALNKGDINKSPAQSIKNLKNDSRARNTLTKEEIDKLFDENKIDDIWYNRTQYMMNYLAYRTGMRLGEIQALKPENIMKDHIIIKYSWDRKYGLKSTKSGNPRIVPITKDLYKLLYAISKESDSEYLFYNTRSKRPYTAAMFGRYLLMALEHIGITNAERKEI